MEKYWTLDLTFVKAKGTIACDNRYSSDPRIVYFKQKEFVGFKLSNYLKSKTVEKCTRNYAFECSRRPYQYLRIRRRFIIPSEVIISNIEKYKIYNSDFETAEEIDIKSDIRYIVDERENLLKPVEIIYFYRYDEVNYLIYADTLIEKKDNRLVYVYDTYHNRYGYFQKFGKEFNMIYNEEAKREIENFLMSSTFNVTPVENIKTALQTV